MAARLRPAGLIPSSRRPRTFDSRMSSSRCTSCETGQVSCSLPMPTSTCTSLTLKGCLLSYPGFPAVRSSRNFSLWVVWNLSSAAKGCATLCNLNCEKYLSGGRVLSYTNAGALSETFEIYSDLYDGCIYTFGSITHCDLVRPSAISALTKYCSTAGPKF